MSDLRPFGFAALLTAVLLAVPATAQKKGGTAPPPDPAIAYVNSGYLQVMNADGSNVRSLAYLYGWQGGHAAWSPDGMQLAFAGNPGGGSGEGLYVIQRDGTGLHRIVTLVDGESGRPAWSPVPTADGKHKIAFRKSLPGNPGWWELHLVNPDGSGLVQLLDTEMVNEADASWSPDATRLVVPTSDSVDCLVLTLGLDAGGALVVTSTRSIITVCPSGIGSASGGVR